MRAIPVYCLKEGMVVGRTVEDAEGRVLLKKGMSIKEAYKKRLESRGIMSIYIMDELQEGEAPVELITRELREKTEEATKKFFITLANNKNKARKEDKQATEILKMIQDIVDEIMETREVVVNGVDIKRYDSYTFEHSVNVAVLSIMIGVELDYDRQLLRDLGVSALFHDIGKVFIPESIINKRGKLTEAEMEQVRTHPGKGGDYVKYILGLTPNVYMGVYEHHERYDGKGYPKGKKGKSIGEFGRIIAVADVFDALTSERPYRLPMPTSEALEYIMASVGTQFDIRMVEIFKKRVAMYPVGTRVHLSNGLDAVVVQNYMGFGSRPKVRLECTGERINLAHDINAASVVITGVIDGYKEKVV